MEERAKLVYLAGPVRSLGRTNAIQVRWPMEVWFMRQGMVTFNPPGAWSCDMSDPCEATIKVANDQMLMISDIMAVMYIHGVQSLGTDAEMVLAASHHKRIIVIIPEGDSVSDAIAWANPLIGISTHTRPITVEFWIVRGNMMTPLTTVDYYPSVVISE